ncbi:MAG: hypothetical protein ABW032_09390 [Burkholderiaceae bacterium]
MTVTRTSDLPEPYFADGQAQPLYPRDGIRMIENAYPGQSRTADCRLTDDFEQAPPDRSVSPTIHLGLWSQLQRRSLPPRAILEHTVIAHVNGGYPYDNNEWVLYNINRQRYPTYMDIQTQIQKQDEVASFLKQRYVPEGSSFLDACAGLGRVAHSMTGWCRRTQAVDMDRPSSSVLQACVPGLDYVESTLADFAGSSQERFDVVFFGNFSPGVSVRSADELISNARRDFRDALGKTEVGGICIVGFCSMNGKYAEPGHWSEMRPLLLERFDRVDTEWVTLGGMFCLLIASGPKHGASSSAG